MIKIITITVDELEAIVHRAVSEEMERRLGPSTVQQEQEDYLDTARVCEELNICERTFQRYRDEKRIPFIQRGRKIYVKRSDLVAFQEANRIDSR